MTLHDGEFEASTLSDDIKDVQFEDIVTVPAGVPIDKISNALNRARIACNTARHRNPKMFEEGDVSESDKEEAREFMKDMDNPAKVPTKQKPLVHLHYMLAEYDHKVIENAVQLRTFATNKILEEVSNTDPKVRLRALELLGKMPEVGLFTDKKEIVIKHKSVEELEEQLREKFAKILDGDYFVETEENTPQEPQKIINQVSKPDLDELDIDLDKTLEDAPIEVRNKYMKPIKSL